jgi:hypothetical protein
VSATVFNLAGTPACVRRKINLREARGESSRNFATNNVSRFPC